MKRNVIIAAVVPVLLFALSVPSAEAGRFGKDSEKDRSANHLERIAKRLELTEEQTGRIEAIQEEAGKKNSALRKNLMRLRHQLAGVMLEDKPDAGKAGDLTRKIGAVQTDMQINMLETRLAIRELLTEEQRDRFIGMFPVFGGGHCSQSGFSRMGDSFHDYDYNAGGGRNHGHGKGRGGKCGEGGHRQHGPAR